MADLVFLGPPGAGKGTQAGTLAERRSIPHVSTGDLFRSAVKAGTAVGLEAKSYLDEGLLVPDEIVIRMVRERLAEPDARQGFILDGFPRTVGQAEALDRDLETTGRTLTAVVSFEISDDRVVERLSGRLTCSSCGAMYHRVHNPPRREGVCDRCGGPLGEREDDRPDTIRRRLAEYREKTAPLISYYEEKSILRRVPAEGTVEEVQGALEGVLGAG